MIDTAALERRIDDEGLSSVLVDTEDLSVLIAAQSELVVVTSERDALRAECDRLRAALSDRYSAALPLGWECPRCHSMRSPYSTYCGCGPAATINGQRVFLR